MSAKNKKEHNQEMGGELLIMEESWVQEVGEGDGR